MDDANATPSRPAGARPLNTLANLANPSVIIAIGDGQAGTLAARPISRNRYGPQCYFCEWRCGEPLAETRHHRQDTLVDLTAPDASQ